MSPLKDRLIAQIAQDGPITVAQYMAAALFDPAAGYYSSQMAADAGPGGDFLTAPEISQIFGELIGAWLAHERGALKATTACALIELGPGRGKLIADIARTLTALRQRGGWSAHLIEISQALRAEQSAALAALGWTARHHESLASVPDGPTLLIANEYLDCLPIRQFVRTKDGWRERLVGVKDADLAFGLAPHVLPNIGILPSAANNAPIGAVVELAPSLDAQIAVIAARLMAHPGRALLIDYGSADSQPGDTLQALYRHQKVDPLASPGQADLTAHVDFAAVADSARASGLSVHGPVPQGAFFQSLGLNERTQALCARHPERAQTLLRQRARLAEPDHMGDLFKVICLSSPNLPPPAGFP